MKKKMFGFLVSFAMVFSLCSVPTVHAEEPIVETGKVSDPVVKGENKNYSTLEEAVADTNNKEITLLKSVTIKTRLNVTHEVTLDLNGYTITCEGQNSSIDTVENGSLTVKDSKGTGVISGVWPIYVEKNGTFTLESGTIKGLWYGICGNGSKGLQGDKGTTININGGKVYQNDPSDPHCAAIYHPQKGVININGGEIIGSVGIELCSGGLTTVNMSGGIVRGTGEDLALNKPESDGCIGDGAAISAINRNYPGGAPYVNITGGTYLSDHSQSIMAYSFKKVDGQYVREDWAEAKEHVKISGGTYSSDVSNFVPSGYKTYKQADGTFKVAPIATHVILDKTEASIEVGNTLNLKATLNPTETLETITSWTSSNESVASVKDGVVTALSAGTTTVTVTTSNGLKATCTVTVKEVEKPVVPEVEVPSVDASQPVEKVEVGMPNKEETENVLKDSFENVKDEALKEAVDKATESGKEVVIVPTIEKIDVKNAPEEVKKDLVKVEKVANDQKLNVVEYLDLNILVVAGDEVLGSLTETTKELTFQVVIPQELMKENRVFYVVRVHNGETSILDVEEKDGVYTFKSDQFSTYALVYKDVESNVTPEVNDKEENKTETPETSDSSMMIHYIVMGMISAMILVVVKKKESLYR